MDRKIIYFVISQFSIFFISQFHENCIIIILFGNHSRQKVTIMYFLNSSTRNCFCEFKIQTNYSVQYQMNTLKKDKKSSYSTSY